MNLSGDDEKLKQRKIAIKAIGDNVKNCYKLKGKFDEISIENFKINKPEFKILEDELGTIKSAGNWFNKFENLAKSVSLDKITEVLREALQIALMKNPENVSKQTKESWNLIAINPADFIPSENKGESKKFNMALNRMTINRWNQEMIH